MATRLSYYVRRDGTEIGPLSSGQINRMFQRGELGPDFPCRSAEGAEWRLLGEVFPHVYRNKAGDPERIQAIKREVDNHESNWLTRTGIVSGLLFLWTPKFGLITAGMAIGCGLVLLTRHRRIVGSLPIMLGILGVTARFLGRM